MCRIEATLFVSYAYLIKGSEDNQLRRWARLQCASNHITRSMSARGECKKPQTVMNAGHRDSVKDARLLMNPMQLYCGRLEGSGAQEQ